MNIFFASNRYYLIIALALFPCFCFCQNEGTEILEESTINWKKDTLEDTWGNNIFHHEVSKYITWDNGLLINVKNDHGTSDTISLRDIISGKDKATQFKDQNNEIVDYSTFENKVVMLDFWFLTCKPCIVELPGIELINKKIKSDDFVLITFCNDPLEEVEQKLLSKRKFNLRIVSNVGVVKNSYPYKLLLSKKGELIESQSSGFIDDQAISKLLKKYIPLIKRELKK